MFRPRIFLACALLVTFALTGCSKTKHGFCEPPNDHLEWFWKHEQGPPWIGSADKCVLCDSSVADDEIAAWVAENAGAEFLGWEYSEEGLTPCLYVYSQGDVDFGDPVQCAKAACAPDPYVNDPVYEAHGMWKSIDPLMDAALEGYGLEGEIWQLEGPQDWAQRPVANEVASP